MQLEILIIIHIYMVSVCGKIIAAVVNIQIKSTLFILRDSVSLSIIRYYYY